LDDVDDALVEKLEAASEDVETEEGLREDLWRRENSLDGMLSME